MVTLNQLEALTMYKSESNFLFVCWSLTEVSFLSRRAEESSVPGKISLKKATMDEIDMLKKKKW